MAQSQDFRNNLKCILISLKTYNYFSADLNLTFNKRKIYFQNDWRAIILIRSLKLQYIYIWCANSIQVLSSRLSEYSQYKLHVKVDLNVLHNKKTVCILISNLEVSPVQHSELPWPPISSVVMLTCKLEIINFLIYWWCCQ